MIQEHKKLLIKDLCGRLPYEVKVSYYGSSEECECIDVVEGIYRNGEVVVGQYGLPAEIVKPYLFPLSTITEEQKKEYDHVLIMSINTSCSQLSNTFVEDWLNKNHFDWRGLILLGLANDATGLGIY